MAKENWKIFWVAVFRIVDFDSGDYNYHSGFPFEHLQIHFKYAPSHGDKSTSTINGKGKRYFVHGLLLEKSPDG